MEYKITKSAVTALILLFSFLAKSSLSIAQNEKKKELPSYVEKVTLVNGKSSTIEFKKESNFTRGDFKRNYISLLELSENDSLQLKRVHKTESEFQSYRYHQYYNGVEIEGAQILLHEKSNKLQSVNGVWIKNMNANTTPSLSKEAALNIALSEIKAQQYSWQNQKEEEQLKKMKKDTSATYYPKGELLLVAYPFSTKPENFKLVYKFDIYSQVPNDGVAIYIDAVSGQIIKKRSLIKH